MGSRSGAMSSRARLPEQKKQAVARIISNNSKIRLRRVCFFIAQAAPR
jgi:hypothetical protein